MFLDGGVLDWTNPKLVALRNILAGEFYEHQVQVGFFRAAGIDLGRFPHGNDSRTVWTDMLGLVCGTGDHYKLLRVIAESYPAVAKAAGEKVGQADAAWLASQAHPAYGASDLVRASSAAVPADGEDLGGDQARAGGAVGLVGPRPASGTEKQTVQGQYTFEEIRFLGVGDTRSRSVCKITASFEDSRGPEFGTAARIGTDLLLTNHHVLFDGRGRPASHVRASFDFRLDEHGRALPVVDVFCDTRTIEGESDCDWAVIRTSGPIPDRYPVLSLTGARPPRVGDLVFIVQHPGGREMKISFGHNSVREVDSERIEYWTDTDEGSSGAPVFNSSWQVVALHYGWVEAPRRHDPRTVQYRNRGYRIERIVAGLAAHGIELGRS
jgi:hypothetical protein